MMSSPRFFSPSSVMMSTWPYPTIDRAFVPQWQGSACLRDHGRHPDLEADAGLPTENVDFATGRGGVDVQCAIPVTVIHGDDVRFSAIDHGEAANGRGPSKMSSMIRRSLISFSFRRIE